MHLAHKILYDLSSSAEAKQRNVQDPDQMRKYLLNPVKLPSFRILELGAGTGIIPAAVLSHQEMEARGVSWTATDQYSMMNLLEKNLSQSGAIAKELDWSQASQVYRFGAPSAKVNFLSAFKATDDAQFDLILATDCIFNPSLFPAFLDTLTLFATPRMTGVLVVCELRQSDMLHDFISAWLTHKGRWSICTLEATKVLGPRLSRGSVVWLGWRM
jgi:predicted nicotinamide N-methyase